MFSVLIFFRITVHCGLISACSNYYTSCPSKWPCNPTLFRLRHSPASWIRLGWLLLGAIHVSSSQIILFKRKNHKEEENWIFPKTWNCLVLIPISKHNIYGASGIITTTWFSMCDLEGFKRICQIPSNQWWSLLSPPLPYIGAHAVPRLSQARLHCFPCVSQSHFHKIIKAPKGKPIRPLCTCLHRESLISHVYVMVSFFCDTQRALPSDFHWSSQLKISINCDGSFPFEIWVKRGIMMEIQCFAQIGHF